MKKVRCAIYTRKSSEEGLEQDFNSLDAQREACAAYVLSQASEGWTLLPDPYDDGGLSGGTLERPALQRLLADIEEGRVDIVVVYKVDRLTRSLLDFAKLVETMDKAGVSFVSVTQSFNTTTSMGRLTLNMLLSFAQFEREVTAERIRDKIAASKARGMWMGGVPPLGYEPDGRSLRIVDEHAAIIRDIHARYRRLGNVRLVAEELVRDGIVSPRRVNSKGKAYGERPFSRGQLYAILRNPVYVGRIAHKALTYPGNHRAIIAEAEWEAVQQQLADNRTGDRRNRHCGDTSLLAGLLFNECGTPITPVHTRKGTRRYRYYVTRPGDGITLPSRPLRIPAAEIETVVRKEVQRLLTDPLDLLDRAQVRLTPAVLQAVEGQAGEIPAIIRRGGPTLLRQVVARVVVHPDHLVMTIASAGLAVILGLPASTEMGRDVEHAIAAAVRRSGMAVRLVHESGVGAAPAKPDPALVRLLLQARTWWDELAKGELDIAALSRREGVTASWMTRVVRLAFLAPAVVEAVVAGEIRAGVDAKSLLASRAVPARWDQQGTLMLPNA